MNAEDSCVTVIQGTFVERISPWPPVSACHFLAQAFCLLLPDLDSSPLWVCLGRCSQAPVWDSWHASGLRPPQGFTGPSAAAGAAPTRGQLVAWLCHSWNPSPGICACPGYCPQNARPLPSCLARLALPGDPLDIRTCFRLWPALLCLCLWLEKADARTKNQDSCPGPSFEPSRCCQAQLHHDSCSS